MLIWVMDCLKEILTSLSVYYDRVIICFRSLMNYLTCLGSSLRRFGYIFSSKHPLYCIKWQNVLRTRKYFIWGVKAKLSRIFFIQIFIFSVVIHAVGFMQRRAFLWYLLLRASFSGVLPLKIITRGKILPSDGQLEPKWNDAYGLCWSKR